MLKKSNILGYHELGEHHYHSIYSCNSILKEMSYDSDEAFIALVTSVHEQYHTMQEMFLGFCLWNWSIKNSLAVSVADYIKDNPNDNELKIPLWKDIEKFLKKPKFLKIDTSLDKAKAHFLELGLIKELYVATSISQNLLKINLASNPNLKDLYPNCFDLTTQDMLECHAAINTEMYISWLINEKPELFSMDIVEKRKPLFRLEYMPDRYSRPLDIIKDFYKHYGNGREFLYIDDHDPKYPKEIKDFILYPILNFLLNHALHIPPHPTLDLSARPDPSTVEDISPPIRLIKLLHAYFNEIISNKFNYRQTLLDFDKMILMGSEALSLVINDANKRSRDKHKTAIESEKLDTSNNFLTIKQTTDLWIKTLNKSDLPKELFPVIGVRLNALNVRLREIWYEYEPITLYNRIRMPLFYVHDGNLKWVPIINSDKFKTDQDVVQYINEYNDFINNQGASSEKDVHDYFSEIATSYYTFTNIQMHKNYIEIGEAILYKGRIECPLTKSIGLYLPCNLRSTKCTMINDSDLIPSAECKLRKALNLFLHNKQIRLKDDSKHH